MMDKSSKICFVYSIPTTFVKKDIEILHSISKKVFTIKSPPFKFFFSFLINRIKEFLKGILFIPKSNVLIVWFSDYHAFIPLIISKIFYVKSILIIGGYDAISDKQIGHGIFSKNNLRQKIAKINIKLATEIWVVDKSLSNGCKEAFIQNNIYSGLINWIPKSYKKIKEVPTGYSSQFWKKIKSKIPKTVLTVANFNNQRVFKLKGIPFILKLAKELPEFKFKVIGIASEKIIPENLILPNVEFIKQKNKTQLREYFSESQFYIQASRLEGLPNALCEAMLCECIPIGNAVFGIPSAIGDTGLLFKGSKEIKKVSKFLKSHKNNTGRNARNRIISLFSEEKRINEFKTT